MELRLPGGVTEYLQAHRTFEYDVDDSELGAISLRLPRDLQEAVLPLRVGRQRVAQDPYAGIDGRYQVTCVDLVCEAEEFDPIGLLGWLPEISAFGCVDVEHGTILSFGDTDFPAIVSNPLLYLESQWGPPAVGEYILPWEHFTFSVTASDQQLPPYGRVCPVHGGEIDRSQTPRSELCNLIRQQHLTEWLSETLAFPCAGVPNSNGAWTACLSCAELEDRWATRIEDSQPAMPVDADSNGWVTCPNCGRRFQASDSVAFRHGRHHCGQKIAIRN